MMSNWRVVYGSFLCAVVAAGVWPGGLVVQAQDAPGPIVSTTIDFLDYCFFKTEPEKGYFSEEEYEGVIRAVAKAGISKIYLRVDVCGKTLYPSTAGKQYTGDGRDPGSTYLVNTLKRYDPAAKTIELGRKYGLQVWCWDTLFDDEATMVHYAPDSEMGRKYGEYPLKDPFLVDNPRFQWRLDPRIEERQKEQLARRQAAGPVTAIRVRSDIESRNNRLNPEEIRLFVSDDNETYREYTRPFAAELTQDRPPILVFSGLRIDEEFIKLVAPLPQPKDNSFTIAGEPRDMVDVFHDGEWHVTSADYRDQNEAPEQSGFRFRGSGRFAWDYGNRVLGVSRFPQLLPLHYGMIELHYEEARRHKLAKLRELAQYPFDGFAYSMRSHSLTTDAAVYGYNAPVREAFRERYGKDIWSEDFDRDRWLDLRAEAVNRYLHEARGVLDGRPFYMDTPKDGSRYVWQYGGLPFQHEAWVEQDSVTGLRMMGFDVGTPLRALVPQANSVEVIRFVDNHPMPPLDVFADRLGMWLEEPGLDEVEFYETLIYTERPEYLEAIRTALESKGRLPASAR